MACDTLAPLKSVRGYAPLPGYILASASPEPKRDRSRVCPMLCAGAIEMFGLPPCAGGQA